MTNTNEDRILKGRSTLGSAEKEPYCQGKSYFKIFPDGNPKLEISLMKEEIMKLLEKEYPTIDLSVQQVIELHSQTGRFIQALENRPFRPFKERGE